MSSLSRRQVRLRREYLYRRSLEGAEKETYEKKRRVAEALAAGKPIPTELRDEEAELRRLDALDPTRGVGAPNSVDDEFARSLRGERLAKVCVSTSRDPSSRLKQFAKELKHLLPNSTRINRGNTRVSDLVDATRRGEFTDLVMVHETRGQPDGLVCCHLPLGPTTYFTLENCVLRHDVDTPPKYSSDVAPHLIFHDFDADAKPLARRLKTVLTCLFPVPKADGQRAVTFYNAMDRISFRHHSWTEAGRDVDLAELGPRFEMRPYMIRLGTLDQPDADVEWVLRPYMNSAKKIL
mmetsp:Transcript_1594/g.4483  ORF Transcript_1594/g.4483 Transcript_1594/m.4483 type:complete len:294 (-) Transcript_1594:37-918(-)